MPQIQSYTRQQQDNRRRQILQEIPRPIRNRLQHKWSLFKKSLPSPIEIPKVTQEQLIALYNSDAFGLRDDQLLEEIESRLIARGEIFLDLSRFVDEIVGSADNAGVFVFGNWTTDGIVFHYMRTKYGMLSSANPEPISEAVDKMKTARLSGNFSRRILAIDSFVHAIHDAGPLIPNFVAGFSMTKGEETPGIAEEESTKFLDRLGGKI